MKRAFLLIATLAVATFACAQANTTSTARRRRKRSRAAQTAPASGSTRRRNSANAPAHSKGAPQAKTQDEFKAYQDVVAKTDTTQMEQAADAFAQKYPNSDLRVVLYNALMNTYRNGGATDRAIAAGRKALAIDPTDPVPERDGRPGPGADHATTPISTRTTG